jgi:hypothetical protein
MTGCAEISLAVPLAVHVKMGVAVTFAFFNITLAGMVPFTLPGTVFPTVSNGVGTVVK